MSAIIRRRLFDHFSADLAHIAQSPVATFICPICLQPFVRDELDTKLTLEHVIPKGLGKVIHALTCSTCNNDRGGSALDSHLHKKIAMDRFYAGCGKAIRADLTFGGSKVRAEWARVRTDGKVSNQFQIIGSSSSPQSIEQSQRAIERFGEGSEMKITLALHSERRAKLALLKAGYLLAFLRLGYGYIGCSQLDAVRQQICNPRSKLLPVEALVVKLSEVQACNRVALIENPSTIRGVLSMISLKSTSDQSQSWGVLLPDPDSSSDFFDAAEALRRAGASCSVQATLLREK